MHEPGRRTRLRRRTARERTKAPAIRQLDWQQPFNTDSPTEPFTEEQVHAVHLQGKLEGLVGLRRGARVDAGDE